MSCRRSRRTMSRALTYELEDVVAELEGGQIIAHELPIGRSPARFRWRAPRTMRLARSSGRGGGDGPELVFAVAHTLNDLMDHLAVVPTIDRAAHAAVYIEEIWLAQIPFGIDTRLLLRRFDHVFVGCEGSATRLSELVDRPVTYLPPAVDLDRFADPRPNPRPIAVYSMGRRNPAHHDAILGYARRNDVLYLYDTHVGNSHIHDHVQHRTKLADLIRRTRYFTVNAPKLTRPGETKGQEEVGYRYFEGAAAGTMMVGARPDTPRFDELLPWADAVVELAPDGSDVVEVLTDLDARPDHREAVGRIAMAESLRRHDVAHRWRTVLKTLGLEEPPAVADRIERLAAVGDELAPAGPSLAGDETAGPGAGEAVAGDETAEVGAEAATRGERS